VEDISEWPMIEPLPLYGRGRDATVGRYTNLVLMSFLCYSFISCQLQRSHHFTCILNHWYNNYIYFFWFWLWITTSIINGHI